MYPCSPQKAGYPKRIRITQYANFNAESVMRLLPWKLPSTQHQWIWSGRTGLYAEMMGIYWLSENPEKMGIWFVLAEGQQNQKRRLTFPGICCREREAMSFIERLNAMIDSRGELSSQAARDQRKLLLNLRAAYLAENPPTDNRPMEAATALSTGESVTGASTPSSARGVLASPPSEWNRQESCSECDGDGCAKCEPPTPTPPQSAEEFWPIWVELNIPKVADEKGRFIQHRNPCDKEIIDFAEAYRQQASSASGWISCSGRLPSESGRYQVWSDGEWDTAEFIANFYPDGSGIWHSGWDEKHDEPWSFNGEITHWQPLPPTPGEPA